MNRFRLDFKERLRCLALVVWSVGFVVDLGMTFVDNWVVGNKKG